MTIRRVLIASAVIGALGVGGLMLNSALAQTTGVTLQSNTATLTRGCFTLLADGGYGMNVHLSVGILLPDGGSLTHEVDSREIGVGNPLLLQTIQTAAQNQLPY